MRSVYAAGAAFSLFLPLWFVYASLAVSWLGGTAGMGVAGIQVIASDHSPPAVWRSALRVGLLIVLTAPALTAPLLLAAAVSLGSVGPPAVWVPVAVAVCLSLLACISPFMTSRRQAWHDILSGTRIALRPMAFS
jgi:RDD family